MELINNMLTTGIVPALFADEEREGIIGTVRKNISIYCQFIDVFRFEKKQ